MRSASSRSGTRVAGQVDFFGTSTGWWLGNAQDDGGCCYCGGRRRGTMERRLPALTTCR